MNPLVDLSTLPPALLFCVIVIYIVCKVLPDSIGLAPADRAAETTPVVATK
jgi:hypothetical protein